MFAGTLRPDIWLPDNSGGLLRCLRETLRPDIWLPDNSGGLLRCLREHCGQIYGCLMTPAGC
eukprot:scaffold123855_cov57-Phaeocystis_antarctica.AAC.1